MVAVTASSTRPAYMSYGAYPAATVRAVASDTEQATTGATATAVTLSDAARAALAERDFPTVVDDARSKLKALLTEADRTSPLQNGKLALDLSSLDQRELYAIGSDESFLPDEREAAGLEMQRRFEAALRGPAAVADVTGNFTNLYKAAAAYLDALGLEERASADWKAGREAITEGLRQLASAPGTLPAAGDSDPVALYLALLEGGETTEPASMTDLADNTRASLDRLYAQAKANGKIPTFNRNTTIGTFIDVSSFSSRALSSMVLDTSGTFSAEEAGAARSALKAKSGATLVASFQSASKSGEPTAFSQNIISAFSSLSPEERRAAGWSDQLYQAAMQSYATTSKLMDMFGQATAGTPGGLASLLGR